jgi:ATP adenylyltransferase
MLDLLWAGWRSAYIASTVEADAAAEALAADGAGDATRDATSRDDGGSVFRRILASGLPDDRTHIVWRGRHCFAILNAFPYTSGHVLVMPYRQVAALEALTPEEHAELWATVVDTVAAVKAAYHPDGVNIGANLGRSAGAGVPSHVHVHVLPRWSGDTNFMTSVANARVMPEPLEESAGKIRRAWPAPTSGRTAP